MGDGMAVHWAETLAGDYPFDTWQTDYPLKMRIKPSRLNKLLTRVTTVSDSRILGKLNFVHADTTLSLIVNKLSQPFNQSLRLFV